MLLFVGSLRVAGNSDFYSKVVVKATPSGAGKVYAAYKDGDYKENGAESGKDSQRNAPTHSYRIKAEANLGYLFNQWNDGNTSDERTDISVTADTDVKKATLTYTASFNIIQYTIELVVGEGTAEWISMDYTVESDDITLPTPTPNDASSLFDGWFENADFSGERVTSVGKGSTGDKTFYAKYVMHKTPEIKGEEQSLLVGESKGAVYSFANISDDENFSFTIAHNVTTSLTNPEHPTEVIGYDKATNTLVAYNAGTARITFKQAETDVILPAEESFDVIVSKRSNALTINGSSAFETDLPFGKEYNALIVSDNPASTIVVEQTSGAEYATYSEGIVTTAMSTGTASWVLSQPGDYMYEAASATMIVNVHAFEEVVAYVLYDAAGGSQFTGGTSGKMELSGPADKLYFDADFTSGAVNTSVLAQYSVDGSTWVDVPNAKVTKKGSYGPYDLSTAGAKYIRFKATGSLTQYYRNIKVTRKTYLEVPATLNVTEGKTVDLNEDCEKTLTIDWSLANGGDLKIVSNNPKFTVSQDVIADVDNNDGTTDIVVTYCSDALGEDEGIISIFNDVYRKDVIVSGMTAKFDNVIVKTNVNYTSYCPTASNVVVPEGVTIFYATKVNEETIHFEEYHGEVLKQGEGVIVACEEDLLDAMNRFKYTTDDAEAIEGNLLEGTLIPTYFAQGEVYFLANKGGNVGFYLNNAGTMPAGKAVLRTSTMNPVQGLAMTFGDDETAISNINASASKTIYNTAGQRIASMQKGINIVNGKKVLR